MLSEDRAVLMDFGIARLIESPGDGVAGTIGYMAPEQITEAVVDARTDLYALGCVLHEMLAGEPVFGKAKRLELAVRHVSTPPPDIRSLRSEAPRWLARALRDLLAKLPYRREIGLARLRSGPRSPARFAIPIGVALVAIAAVALWRVTVEPTWRPHVIAYQAYEEEGGTTSLSPDGRWLAFDSDRAQRGAMRIYIMDRVTLQTVQLATPHGRNVVAPRWTRDGGAILFQGEMPDGDHVFRQAVADSPPQAVGSPTDLGPGLSPDACGRDAIVYVDSGPSAKRLMLAKDDDRRALVTIGSNETLWMPRCNALGTQIVFARGMAGPWSSSNDLFVVDRIGATRRLTTDHASSNAMFSPDGRSIVYAARRDGRHDLYVMPATGGSARAMKLDGATLVADISHDGRLVAFHREESSWFPAISEGGMPRLITSQRGIYVWVRPVGTDRVLARRETASQSEIVVIETSDGSISTIASGYAPFPSIDGKRVYFRPATTPNQLAMVPIGGGPATIVASVPGTIMFGVDGPDGAHLGVETRPGAIEAFRVVSGRAEPEGVPGIVTVAPDGGWRAVTILFERSGAESRSRLQLIPPGTPLSAPSHELETGSVINPWLDDRRISYCVAAGCRILDVVAGTTTEVPAWANFYQRLAIVMPDGKRVVDSLTVSRLTRHLVTNFDAWPW
jgi:Tol biopolymer transport system component